VLSLQRLCKKVLREKGIKTQFIELEKPWQNGDSEVFNGILRDDSQNKWRFL
jgi:IS30 family transposase